MSTAEQQPSTGLRLGYASGSVATGAFGTVPGLLLLPYLTDTLGVASALAGLMVFLPKAWDVVLNPITGRLSDRAAVRSGSRRPFLLWGGLALAISFVALFSGPHQPSWLAIGWVVFVFLAAATAYSFFQVPYVAMPAELTHTSAGRTRLMTWRVALLAVTILVSGATAPLIRDLVGGAAGYRAMACFVGVLIMVGTVGAFLGTRSAPPVRVRTTVGSLVSQMALVAKVADFRRLLGTFAVQALGIGAMLAGVDYVARQVLGSPGASSVLFACFVGPALLVTPLWGRVADRLGKKSGYVAATGFLLAGALGLMLAGRAPIGVVFAATAVAGIGYAGAQVFPMAMVPDVAAVDARASGENRIGLFTGVWTAGETLGLALGPALFAVVLAAGGYVSSAGEQVVQPESAVSAIRIGFSLLPALLFALSLLTLRRYRLTSTEVDHDDPPTARPLTEEHL